jgi:glycosyltransferase involved in cell wall biosynthesis
LVRVLHAFSTFALGGPQARFLKLVEALGPQVEHHVLAMDGNTSAIGNAVNPEAIQLVNMPIARGRNFDNVPRLMGLAKRLKPDAIVSYNFGAFEWTLANALMRRHHIHLEEGFGPQETVQRLPRRNLVRKWGLKLSPTRLAVISNTMATIATQEWGVRPERVLKLTNGVKVRREWPGLRARPGLMGAEDQLVVGTVAALRAEKRIDRLIDAVASLHRQGMALQLLIAGSGPEESALRQQVAALGLERRVAFLGHLSDPGVLYSQIDLFALSSDTEQVPMAVLEAMAAGLPVAATRVGDLPEILPSESAAWLTALDAEALGQAIARFNAAGLRERVGRANHAQVMARFSEQAMLASWRGALGA